MHGALGNSVDFRFQYKPYEFRLLKPVKTSQGTLHARRGWLLRLEDPFGRCGWGEVSPLNPQHFKRCYELLVALNSKPTRRTLEDLVLSGPGPLAFGIGAALGEIDGLVGASTPWLEAPYSAMLLSAGKKSLLEVDLILSNILQLSPPLTVKWKVGVLSLDQELSLMEKLLDLLPSDSRLRLDANGGWDRRIARRWAAYLHNEARLEWFEQPLPVEDISGLRDLATHVPIALDESLSVDNSLRQSWIGWQVRRPVVEGDPRILLNDLKEGRSYRMISTAFETGIGRRWVHHLAAIQQNGPTPTAPGLAPGWFPEDLLFSNDPELVWHAT